MSFNDSNAYTAHEAPAPRKHGLYLWGAAAIVWGVVALWLFFTPSAYLVEHLYSRGLYRLITIALVPLTNSVPTSLALYLVVGLATVWIVFWLAYAMARRRYFWGLKWLFIGGAFVALAFVLLWGAGYKRMPAAERMELGNLKESPLTLPELEEMSALALATIHDNAPQAQQDRAVQEAIASISRSMSEVLREWEGTAARLPLSVKATPPGLLLANGTSGICAPFTLEPHVDGAIPDTGFVFVAAHELAHIGGMCSEDEATLLGFAAGLRAENTFARYAVALDIYLDIVRNLPRDQRQERIEALPEVAREDIQRIRETSEKYRIDWLQRRSWQAYDKYLKSQGVQEGVRSYGLGITLLGLSWRKGLITFPGQTEVPPAIAAERTNIPSAAAEDEPAPVLETERQASSSRNHPAAEVSEAVPASPSAPTTSPAAT